MIEGLNHITIAVSNLEKSLDFYCHVLGFVGHVKWNKGAYISTGEIWVCLSLDTPQPSMDYSHIAWNASKINFAALSQRIVEAQATIWKPNSSEGESLYFLDPDGNKLEIHVGSLEKRLASLKQAPYDDIEWLT